jgi:hypothetical protein
MAAENHTLNHAVLSARMEEICLVTEAIGEKMLNPQNAGDARTLYGLLSRLTREAFELLDPQSDPALDN